MSNVQSVKYKVEMSEIKPLVDKGGEIYVLLSPKTVGMKNLIMGMGITPANEKVVRHVHNYSEECFFVVQGRGKLHLDNGVEEEFRPGSAVRVPQGVAHWIENTGFEELRVIFASAPLAPSPEAGHNNFESKES